MKIIIPKDEVVLIGLIYKYIATGKNEIYKFESLNYVNEVNKNLKNMDNQTCEINIEDDEFSTILHMMNYDKKRCLCIS